MGGRYRLAEAIGQGGMGRVWRARDETLGRAVAVKEVFLPVHLSPEEHRELTGRAVREARAAAALNHPGIVTVHDVVEQDGAPWIVMELLAGNSLAAVLKEQGRLPWQRVAALGADLADALAHAHQAGIVHRDMKPDNVFLAQRRTVVTDFGIARVLDASTQLTQSGMMIGTPQYMPPEQLEGTPVGTAGDLWSLGATLYTALEGEPPFNGPSLPSIWLAITQQPLPPAQHAGPLGPLLESLLHKDPERRPTAQQAAAQLEALHARALAAPSATPPSATPPPVTAQATAVQPAPRPETVVLRTAPEPEATRKSGWREFAIATAIGLAAVGGTSLAVVEIIPKR